MSYPHSLFLSLVQSYTTQFSRVSQRAVNLARCTGIETAEEDLQAIRSWNGDGSHDAGRDTGYPLRIEEMSHIFPRGGLNIWITCLVGGAPKDTVAAARGL